MTKQTQTKEQATMHHRKEDEDDQTVLQFY